MPGQSGGKEARFLKRLCQATGARNRAGGDARLRTSGVKHYNGGMDVKHEKPLIVVSEGLEKVPMAWLKEHARAVEVLWKEPERLKPSTP